MKPRSLVSVLATAWLAGVVVLTLPLVHLAGLVVARPEELHRAQRFICSALHRYLRAWPLWRVRVVGTERLPAGAAVLVANHQSAADILALMGLDAPFRFVSKASMFTVPLIGWWMKRLGYVSLVRGSRASMEAMMTRCRELLEAGERVLIFPEGTYASGAVRLPFRRGAFRLAQQAQAPVVPVVVRGTAALLFEDGPWFAAHGTVEVEVMEPLGPPAADAPLEPYVRAVEARFSRWLDQPFPSEREASQDLLGSTS